MKAIAMTSTLHLSQYSDKAIVLHGDTRPIKDAIKSAGGKFNGRLRDGSGTTFAGWIFPASKTETVLVKFMPGATPTAPAPAEELIQDPGEIAADNWSQSHR